MYSSGTAAAFTADSFVIDTDDYLFESIQSSSFSLRNSASTYAVEVASTDSSGSSYDLYSVDPTISMSSNSPAMLVGVYDDGLFEGQTTSSFVDLSSWSWIYSSGYKIARSSFTVPSTEGKTWKQLNFPLSTFSFTYDVSSLNTSCLEFSGVYKFNAKHFTSTSSYLTQGYDLDILIDGAVQHSYTSSKGSLDLGGWIYNGSFPVSNVTFRFHLPSGSISVSSGDVVKFELIFTSCDAVINGLTDDGVLNGLNNNAQDAMNQQDAIESQWTGSMTENFNNLSLSDFTFPVAAVNGFSLISGIFNDLWNAMGDFRIVYVFPLTLGVVLLLIGRLSRTSVKRSSGRGDDGA